MLLLCGSIIAGMSFEIFSVSYLVPGSACELNTTSTEQGLMAGVPLIGIIATSHFWGYLADTQGRKKILTISMTISFMAGAMASLSPHWIVLSAFKLVSSSSVSGAYAIGLTLLGECTPRDKRNLFIILTTSLFLLSTGIMAVITIPILPLTFSYYIPFLDIHFNSWRLLDLIFCLPCAIGAVGVACSFESPKYLMTVGRRDEALETLKNIFVLNTGKDRELYEVDSVVLDEESATAAKGLWASMIAQTVPLLRPPLLTNTLLLAALFIIVFLGVNPFIVWLPYIINAFMTSVQNGDRDMTICEMIRSSSNSSAGADNHASCSVNAFAMTMVFSINFILAFLNIVSSKIVSLIGRKKYFIILQLLSSIAGLVMNSVSLWIVSAILFVFYMFPIVSFGLLTTYSVDIFPTYIKAMAVCVTWMCGRVSAVVGINILKNLIENNCEAAFYIFGSVTMCGGLVGMFLPSDEKLAKRMSKGNPTP
ncbi:hypothetical protein O3G_MSEX005347 [Manduca sexta]|nr:hypothetical protein O3G_MSEX005347 [Manduca sexta]KAG6448220.1 hypothetical protein O3G_MSEX005347 [Manduca sexta]